MRGCHLPRSRGFVELLYTALAAAIVHSPVAHASSSCHVGTEVLYIGTDGRGSAHATILRRDPGQEVFVQWQDGASHHLTAFVPAASLRTLEANPCARAALCFFGRVGGPHRYDERARRGYVGSLPETLDIAAPTIWKFVLDANPEFEWDVFAHTWDWLLVPHIRKALDPVAIEGEKQPEHFDSVHSFAASTRRSADLKTTVEVNNGFVYDLVVLMRYDMFFMRPLRFHNLTHLDKVLWTGHWCSINAEDLQSREIVLNLTRTDGDIRSRKSGWFAPSQFVAFGLHDFWFASSSKLIDKFVMWGHAIDGMRAYYENTDSLPFHCAHFYTFIYAHFAGIVGRYVGVPYIDYTLVRYRNCRIQVGEEIMDSNLYCNHWTVSYTNECEQWIKMAPGWSARHCPIAGRKATLEPGSFNCGRF